MNRYIVAAILTTLLWNTLLSKGWTQPRSCISQSLPEVSNSVNSFRQGDVIVIGKVPNRHYVVVVPGKSEQLLNVVRSYVTDAFLAHHRLGAYVYAGGSANRHEAECLSSVLRSHGLDARVVYFH
ncbi:MAG: hypothetical protein V7K32_23705 [Nostoc sp.]|uniref:hypothetical protein n=1 Tax=Nostoc sp. TaxID=1180 RepID=UPI002FFBC1B5